MTGWEWLLLGVSVQLVVGLAFPKRIGKGLITKPMWRWPLVGARKGTAVRLRQILMLWLVDIAVDPFTADLIATVVFWLAIIVLYMDDYLFGDDEGKRRWDAVRNKVKWKMALPAPAPQKDSTA